MILNIIKFGDPDSYKLRSKNIDVNINNPFLNELIQNMFETLTCDAALSAPQVGFNLNFFIVKEKNFRHIFINPEIKYLGLNIQNLENDLSFPDMIIPVNRREFIEIKYLNIDFEVKFSHFNGLTAMLIQQGYDHLNCKLIID